MRDPPSAPGSSSVPRTGYQSDDSQELTQLPSDRPSVAPLPIVRTLVPVGQPSVVVSDSLMGPDLFAAPQPPLPQPVAVPAPPRSIPAPPISVPPPPVPMPARPPVALSVEESDEPSLNSAPRPLPCTLRTLLAWHKAHPGGSLHEDLAAQVLKCVSELHAQSMVLGERLVPENLMCMTDGSVRLQPHIQPPQRTVIEQYSAPELLRGGAPDARSDVFGAAAIAYECLAGRTLKVMFMPMILQTGKTDTWFADPGASMQDPYKTLLRKALSSRPSLRHANASELSDDFQDAWTRVHRPKKQAAVEEVEKPFWNRGSKAAVIAIVFLLLLSIVAFFPVERFDQADVPTVRPSLEQ